MEPFETLTPVTTAEFIRKASGAAELPDSAESPAGNAFRVVKVIELSWEQYRYFSEHLAENMPFIAENKHLTGVDERGVIRCLMITSPVENSCILTDSRGSDYADLAAYVSYKHWIDTKDVPVEWLDRTPRDAKAKVRVRRNGGRGR